jgi:predicted O-methyltransferase YrrM
MPLRKLAALASNLTRRNRPPASPETEAFLDSQTIPGWLTETESRELYRLAAAVTDDNPVCCEIGTWIGRSAVLISLGLRGKCNPRLYCVDPFDLVADEPWHKTTYKEQMGLPTLSRKRVFLRTLKVHGVDHIAEPVEALSRGAAASFDRPLDFLFIDGDHSYANVLGDYEAWSPKLKPGGVLAFHDYHPPGVDTAHDGPRRVIHEHVIDNPLWTQQRFADKLYVAVKAK